LSTAASSSRAAGSSSTIRMRPPDRATDGTLLPPSLPWWF
jgi:hypothetical protein